MSEDLRKKVLGGMPKGIRPPLPPRAGLLASSSSSDKSKYSTDNKTSKRNKRDYTQIPWTNYFDKYETVITDSDKKNSFRVYTKGETGPVFFFLHGGGFSGLTWALLASQLVQRIECRCYGLDIRGHGDTFTSDDEDLSIETLSNDVKIVIETLWKEDCPPIVLVGHSMGGAIAVHTAASNYVKNLIALVVIDVVEGSALDALSSMQTFLQGRPRSFNSVEQAIEYNVRSGAIKNAESARVSIIGQLKKQENTDLSSSMDQDEIPISMGSQSHEVMQTEIAEEDETDEQLHENKEKEAKKDFFQTPEGPTEKYAWRIDLTKTEKYWKNWFKGLSSLFLSVNVPKLLLLAGVDRLDKDLMVGQMQGKFQMQVLPLCGHAVHEDSPDHVADALANFMIRYKFTHAIDSINPPNLCC